MPDYASPAYITVKIYLHVLIIRFATRAVESRTSQSKINGEFVARKNPIILQLQRCELTHVP